MAKAFALHGDKHSHGGYVMAQQETDDCLGRPYIREGDPAVCSIHGKTTVSTASSPLYIDDERVALDGDRLACGASIIASGEHAICD